jgi:hypothetical protein
MHGGPEQIIPWHADEQYTSNHIAKRSGDDAKKALEGEGHKLVNRTK